MGQAEETDVSTKGCCLHDLAQVRMDWLRGRGVETESAREFFGSMPPSPSLSLHSVDSSGCNQSRDECIPRYVPEKRHASCASVSSTSI